MSTELKKRKRSLLAWIVVFSLLLGMVGFQHMEAQAATAVGGVSLTVNYDVNGTQEVTQTYEQYYVDEAAGTKEESVTITTVSATSGGLTLPDNTVLVAWQMNDTVETTILPGATTTLNWSDLIGVTTEATLTLNALTQEYSITEKYLGEDYNYYYLLNTDSLGEISINYGTNAYTVTAPGKPQMNSHEFLYWELLSGDTVLGTAGAGEVFASSGVAKEFSYTSQDTWEIKAEWTPKATINFYANEEDYFADEVYSYVNIVKETDSTGAAPFTFTTPGVPTGDSDAAFLTWKSYFDSSYIRANTEVSYETWPSLSSGYIGKVVGTWLTPIFAFNDVAVGQWSNAISVDTSNSKYFTVSAPAMKPETNIAETKKTFSAWNVIVGDQEIPVAAGETISIDGEAYLFDYETYANGTLTFVAEWKDLLYATVTYDFAGGTYNGSAEPFVIESIQKTGEEETFILTMLGEPQRTGYTFCGWNYTDEAGTDYMLEAGSSTEGILPELYYGVDTALTFTATWQQTATVNYASEASLEPVKTDTVERKEEETVLSITLPEGSIVSDSQGGAFLAWSGDGFSTVYALPGAVMTVPWETVAQYDGQIDVTAHWLRDEIGFGDITVNDFTGSVSVNALEEGFTVTAPVAPTAEITEKKYFFLNWLAEFQDAQGSYEVGAGEAITSLGEDGTTAETVAFSYADYADSTIVFTARWQEALKATFSFEMAGGAYKDETTPLTLVNFQNEMTDTTFEGRMPGIPVYDGYSFEGWQYVAEDGTEYVFGADEKTGSQNLTFTYGKDTEIVFTALWKEIPTEASVVFYHDEEKTNKQTEKVDVLMEEDGTFYSEFRTVSGLLVDETKLLVGWYNEEKGYIGPVGKVRFDWSEDVYVTEMIGQWATMKYDFAGVEVEEMMTLPTVAVSSDEDVRMVYIAMPNTGPGEVETEEATYTFVGWNVSVLGETYEVGADNAPIGNFSLEELVGTTVTATAVWNKTIKETTVSEGTIELIAGVRYVFPAGNWKIAGDNTIYAGGMAFYVPATGTYDISESEE